jgi:hypothetical protein
MEYFSKKNQQFLESLEAVPYLIISDKEINGEIFSFVTYNGIKYFSEWYGFYTGNDAETGKYGKLMYQRSYDYNENYVNLLRVQSLFRRHSELCGRFVCYHTILKIVENGIVLGVVTLYDSNLFFETYINNIGMYFENHWDIFRWILVSYTIFSNLAILHKNNVYYLNVHPSSISYNDDEVISRFMKFTRFKNSCTGDCYTYSGLKENINSDVLKIVTIFTKAGQNAEKALVNELKMIDFFSALITILELYINDGKYPSENYFIGNQENSENLFERIKERCSQKKAETPHIHHFVDFLLENLYYIVQGNWGHSPHFEYSPELFVIRTEQIFGGCIPKAMMENHRKCYSILLEDDTRVFSFS